MEKLPKHELSEISDLVCNGRVDLAKRKVNAALRRYYKFAEMEQLFLICMLANLGQTTKVISLIGPELTFEQMGQASIYTLIRQAMLAKIKAQNESLDAALRITRNVIKNLKTRAHQSLTHYAFALDVVSANLLYCFAYDEVFALEPYYPESFKEGNINYFFFRLSMMEAKFYSRGYITKEELDDLEKEREKLQTPIEKIHWDFSLCSMRCLFKQITDPRFFLGQLTNALKETPQFDYWFHFLSASAHYQMNDEKRALELFEAAHEKASTSQEQLATIYWLEKLNSSKIHFEDKVYIRCLPSYSGYSFLCGNRFISKPIITLPAYQEAVQESLSLPLENKHWFISNKMITPMNYSEIQPKKKTLDLSAGIIIGETGEIIHLTETRTKCLMTLIGGGAKGIHEIFLIDQVYPEHNFDQVNAELRTKNLLMQLKKLGIVIKQKKKHFHYDFQENDFDIIFPLNHQSTGSILYCKKHMPLLTQKSVAKLLGIKDSTASLYLHEWREKKLIERRADAPYGTWFFSQNS